jgi:hypothetical protein
VRARMQPRAHAHAHARIHGTSSRGDTHDVCKCVVQGRELFSFSLSLSLPLSLWERNGKRSQIPCVRGCVCVCVMVLYACQVDVSRAMLVTVIAVFGKGVELRD